ncbi:MAG: hypothetical protein QXI19_06290, partial [Candidatus Caldarchaeum sp.]
MELTITLPAGESLRGKELGFFASAILIDNPTGQWYFIPEANRYVMPFTVGNAFTITPTQVGTVLAETPIGMTSAPDPRERVLITYIDTPLERSGVTVPSRWTVPMTIVGQLVTLNVNISASQVTLNVSIQSSVTLNVNIQSSQITLNVNIVQSQVTLNVNIASSVTLNVNIAQSQVTLNVSIVSATTTLNINIAASSITLNMNLLLAPPDIFGQSLIPYGGFDTGSPVGWDFAIIQGTGSYGFLSTPSRSGTGYFLELHADANSQVRMTTMDLIPVQSNAKVWLHLYTRRPTSYNFGVGRFTIAWYNSARSFISQETYVDVPRNDYWSLNFMGPTAPSNATFARVIIEQYNVGYGAAGKLWVDDVMLNSLTMPVVQSNLMGVIDIEKWTAYTAQSWSSFSQFTVTAG